jgi:hypothetical protein
VEEIVRDDSGHGCELSQLAARRKGRIAAPLRWASHES